MAAPAAGQATAPAAGDAGQSAGQAAPGQQDGQQQAAALDPGQLFARLDGMNQMLESQRDLLQAEPWKPADDGQEQADPGAPDLSFLDDQQPGYTPEAAAQGLQDLLNSIAQEKAEALVQPLAKQQQEMLVRQQTDDLITRFPQMGDDAVASKVVDTARLWGESIGKPELGDMPQVWELMYLAGRAADQVKQESAANGGSAATLEGPGGASPGGTGQGAAPTTQSVTASWGGNSLPLFGTKQR